MKQLLADFREAKQASARGEDALRKFGEVAARALTLLAGDNIRELPAKRPGATKKYCAYARADTITRPLDLELFIRDSVEFMNGWDTLRSGIEPGGNRIALDVEDINCLLYTAVMSFCLCTELGGTASRAGSGSYFERLLASLLRQLMPNHAHGGSVPLTDADESAKTDIVTTSSTGAALVFAAKISTRERISQPFVHQRMLDVEYGEGTYRTVIVCVNEVQRKKDSWDYTCVPKTLRQYQHYIARIEGLYYVDPPPRYLDEDVTSVVHVGSVGDLLTRELATLA